jgi:hypothetical protein
MTRWLQAAQRASEAGTKPTKLTEPSPEGVLSEKSVLSEGVRADPVPEMTPDELARDIFEERAAIREFDGGQTRAEAERAAWPEARRAAGITALDDWRREADDLHNPDNWK